MRVAVRQQPRLAPLAANPTLLVPAKCRLGRRLLKRVDKDRTGLQPARNLRRLVDVRAPHARAQPGVRVVGARNDFLEVRPGLCRDDGAKGLFLDDAGGVGRVVDDGRRDEVAFPAGQVRGADGEGVALGGAVSEEAFDALVLHLVLHGAEQVVAVVGVADFDRLGEGDHLRYELLVDALVDVDALGGDADLARVLEGAHDDLGCDLLDVDVRQDDGGVVAAELERDALQCLGRRLHDLLARGDGTGEGDLGNVRVLAHLCAELVVAADDLDHAGREDFLGELNKLERRVRCEWRRLDDDAVSCHDSRGDLAHRQNQREVPGADGAADTEGRVLGVDSLLIVLELLAGNVERGVVANEAANTTDFSGREFPLLHVSTVMAILPTNLQACPTPCTAAM